MKKIKQKHIDAVKTILEFIGEDVSREGLQDTPERFLKAWRDYWGAGYTQKPKDIMKIFTDGASSNQMIVVKNIPIFSHCEHHLAPIIGKATVAYISKDKIIGLSKIARISEMYARRLQVQERLTNQIADTIYNELECIGVGVYIEAEHLCMTSRGIQSHGSITTTTALRGDFLTSKTVKEEFLSLIK